MIVLPKPPSINHIYGYTSRGGFARSFITKEGVAWFNNSIDTLTQTYAIGHSPITEPVKFHIHLFTSRDQDIDNILKPILDLFGGMCLDCRGKFSSRKPCKCGTRRSVIANDKQVVELEVLKTRVKKKDDEKVWIILTNMV